MANRVVISICGEEYTFVADESASYMQKVGNLPLCNIAIFADVLKSHIVLRDYIYNIYDYNYYIKSRFEILTNISKCDIILL